MDFGVQGLEGWGFEVARGEGLGSFLGFFVFDPLLVPCFRDSFLKVLSLQKSYFNPKP